MTRDTRHATRDTRHTTYTLLYCRVNRYNRDWRFHKALQLWFIRVDSEPVAKTTGYERGTYIFFDVTNWKKVKKENFLLYYDQIAELPKLLPLQPIGPPSGSPALTSPAQALNQHSSSSSVRAVLRRRPAVQAKEVDTYNQHIHPPTNPVTNLNHAAAAAAGGGGGGGGVPPKQKDSPLVQARPNRRGFDMD
jgi:hypothetical protein